MQHAAISKCENEWSKWVVRLVMILRKWLGIERGMRMVFEKLGNQCCHGAFSGQRLFK